MVCGGVTSDVDHLLAMAGNVGPPDGVLGLLFGREINGVGCSGLDCSWVWNMGGGLLGALLGAIGSTYCYVWVSRWFWQHEGGG